MLYHLIHLNCLYHMIECSALHAHILSIGYLLNLASICVLVAIVILLEAAQRAFVVSAEIKI